MARKSILILLGILLLGFLIRVYRITSLPMYGDELTMVYDTYSVLKTGMDSTGQVLPLTFKMGAGRPGGYIYFSLPFVALFGPTELGVRALSVLSGLGIIVLMYFLGRRLFDERVALLASFLAAISPWDIYLSRGGFEAHLALFSALAGIVFFLYADKQKWFYVLWAVFWGLTIHTYPTFKLTLPLVLVLLLWYHNSFKKLIKERIFLVSILILALFAVVSIQQTLFANSEQRFLSLNLFANEGLKKNIVQLVSYERNISMLPQALKPVFINRSIEYSRILAENYVKNLSPNFIYLRGDGNPRHNPAEYGMFYLVELPLLFVGIVNLWWKDKRKLKFLTFWILIVPLATMFIDEAHGLRNDLMIPPFLIISSYALSKLSRRNFIICIVLIVAQLMMILVRVYTIAPQKFTAFWSYAAKVDSEAAINKQPEFKKIYLSDSIDNIEYAYPVYARIDPMDVINQYGRYPKIYGNAVITNLKTLDQTKIGSNSLIISE